MFHQYKLKVDVTEAQKVEQHINQVWHHHINRNLGPWLLLLDAIEHKEIEHFIDNECVLQSVSSYKDGKLMMKKGTHLIATLFTIDVLNKMLSEDVYCFLFTAFYSSIYIRPGMEIEHASEWCKRLYLEMIAGKNFPSRPAEAYKELLIDNGVDPATIKAGDTEFEMTATIH